MCAENPREIRRVQGDGNPTVHSNLEIQNNGFLLYISFGQDSEV